MAAIHLEATAELSCGQVKDSSYAIPAGSGQVLAIRGHSHGIEPLLGGIQGGGGASLGIRRQGLQCKAALRAACLLALKQHDKHIGLFVCSFTLYTC